MTHREQMTASGELCSCGMYMGDPVGHERKCSKCEKQSMKGTTTTTNTATPIHLACFLCDRDDFGEFTPERLASIESEGWEHVSQTVLDPNRDPEDIWWTHIGLCPECSFRHRTLDLARENQSCTDS